jgi:MerR family transcriptional regulator, copper efflux regulator
MDKKYLNIQQAARLIGVTELTLRNWDKAGKFVANRHPINNYRVYALDQIEALMQKLGKPKLPRKLVIKVIEEDGNNTNESISSNLS